MALPSEEEEAGGRGHSSEAGRTDSQSSRLLFLHGGSLLLVFGLLVGVILGAVDVGEREAQRRPTVLEQSGFESGDFCDKFSDPDGCRAFRSKAKYRYWTEEQVKDELWKVMKGVAMMEEKLTSSNAQHSDAVSKQQRYGDFLVVRCRLSAPPHSIRLFAYL
jgi:hypothetical protein